MKILIDVLLVAAVFSLGLWLGNKFTAKKWKTKARTNRLRQQLVELTIYEAMLVELRKGRLENAMESSEFGMDCGVYIVSQRMAEAQGQEREEAVATLKAIKAYRQQWPRQPKVELLATEDCPATAVTEAAEDSRKVLESLEA